MTRFAILSLAGSLVAAGAADAQLFHRAIGFTTTEGAYSVENCSAASGGGFVTAGRINTSAGSLRDIYVVRYSPIGDDIWTRIIGTTSNMDEVGYSVRQTLDGGFIIASETNFISGLGIALTRLTAGGALSWSRAYAGTPFLDFPSGTAVRELSDGTFTAIGRYRPGVQMLGRMLRVSPAGAPIWANTYQVVGNGTHLSFTDLRPVLNAAGVVDGYFVSGWVQEPTSNLRSAIIVRTDAAGNPVASWQYSLPNQSISADGLVLLGSNVVFSGRITNAAGVVATTSIIVSVTQAAGGVNWARREADFRNGFAALATDTGVIVAGTEPSSGGISLVKLSAAGGLVFANTHRAQGEGHDVIAMPGLGAGYVATGFEGLAPVNGLLDVALIKTNAVGDPGCLVSPKPGPVAVSIIRTPRQVVRTFNFENVTMPVDVRTPNSGNIIKCLTAAGEGSECPADWNGDRVANSQDFFEFLQAFFADEADFNFDGVSNTQDLFDFLEAFFAGC